MFSSREVVQQNAFEREIFRQHELLLRRERQTCKESLSLKQRQFLAKKSKLLLECKNSSEEQNTSSSSSCGNKEQHISGEWIEQTQKCTKTCSCNANKCGCEGISAIRLVENSSRSIAEQSREAFISLESVTDDTMSRNLRGSAIKKQRPKSKKFSSAVPQVESPSTPLQPYCKPKSPTKRNVAIRADSTKASTRSRRPLPGHGHEVRIEPGLHLDPSQSIEITNFSLKPQHGMKSSCSSDKFMDSTQRKIKAFLDKTCADAVRSRATIRPAVSISDLGSVDEQQMPMPILVDGVLGPEEKKRQVSMVYPMRTPSPRPIPTSHPQGTGDSSYRTPCSEFCNKPSSPLNLPPILLPPVRENQKFQPRQSSWMRPCENRVNKPISEEDWRSLRKCRYLRVPEPRGVRFNLMDNIEHIFK